MIIIMSNKLSEHSLIDEVEHVDYEYKVDREGYAYREYMKYNEGMYSRKYRFATALKAFIVPFILFIIFFVYIYPIWFSFIFLFLGLCLGYIAYQIKHRDIYNFGELKNV